MSYYKKGYFKSAIKYNVPGFPSQENSMSLDKDQFIDSVLSGQQALQDYESSIDIQSIKISRDKTKATVQTRSTENGVMPIPSESGSAEMIPVRGDSSCDQILMLEKKIIQMYSANCTTEITFISPF